MKKVKDKNLLQTVSGQLWIGYNLKYLILLLNVGKV